MGKKKWYVVTVGKAIGVFDTWSEVQPLINGVSGALHESFPTREEAERVFKRQLESGVTKVIGGTQSNTVSPQCLTHFLAPLAFSTNSPLERSSPRMQESRTDAFGPRTSSLEMAAHSESPSRRRSRHRAFPPSRSISPPVVHPNVSYTRGASSVRSSPQYRRQEMPRTVVRTPTDLQSYPDEEPNYISSSHALPEAYTHRNPSVKSDNNPSVFSGRDVPSTPQRRTMRPTIVMKTPSYLQSYPSDEESTASSTPSSEAGSILSPLPLDYPAFLPPETSSPRLSRQGSDASSTGSPQHHSRRPSRRSGSWRYSHPRHDSQCQMAHVAPPSLGDHNHCRHTCPHCKNDFVYTSADVNPAHLMQPMDSVHDPRSPTAKNDIILSHASLHSIWTTIDAPRLDIEHHMNNLFIRA